MSTEKVDIEKLLSELDIKYVKKDNIISFSKNDIDFWIDDIGKIGVNKDFFGLIPHVMPSGRLCVSGNNEISVIDDEKITLKKTIEIYAPWLFSLDLNYCVAEILSEIDFYVRLLFNSAKCIESTDTSMPLKYTECYVISPTDLWEKIGLMEPGIWYKFTPVELENSYVYLSRNKKNNFEVKFDRFSKSRMRVSGNEYDKKFPKTAFIGVGSVNSYVIKKLSSQGMRNMVLIDDDIVTVDNLFRFAFPFLSLSKIGAVEKFVSCTFQDYCIEKINTRIGRDSENCLYNAENIYVSVDNFMSWLEIIIYFYKKIDRKVTIFLSGVDVFGGFGKIIKIPFDPSKLQSQSDLIDSALKFLEYKPVNGIERRQMIGNGCGKSIAVYSELDLMRFAEIISNTTKENEVVYVPFEDRN